MQVLWGQVAHYRVYQLQSFNIVFLSTNEVDKRIAAGLRSGLLLLLYGYTLLWWRRKRIGWCGQHGAKRMWEGSRNKESTTTVLIRRVQTTKGVGVLNKKKKRIRELLCVCSQDMLFAGMAKGRWDTSFIVALHISVFLFLSSLRSSLVYCCFCWLRNKVYQCWRLLHVKNATCIIIHPGM